jgi:DnaJ-domain-containing protein 1
MRRSIGIPKFFMGLSASYFIVAVALVGPDKVLSPPSPVYEIVFGGGTVWSFDTAEEEAELLRVALMAYREEDAARARSSGFTLVATSTSYESAASDFVVNLLKRKENARIQWLTVVLAPPLCLGAIGGALAGVGARRRAREDREERDVLVRRQQAQLWRQAEQRQRRAWEQAKRDAQEHQLQAEQKREAERQRQRERAEAAAKLFQKEDEWWSVLEVSPSASPEEIRRGYIQKMQQYHPDRVAGLAPEFVELAERRSKVFNAAYARARDVCRGLAPPKPPAGPL